MRRWLRGWFIVWVVLRYGLDELALSGFRHPVLGLVRRVLTIGRDLSAPRGQRLREELDSAVVSDDAPHPRASVARRRYFWDYRPAGAGSAPLPER
ncbi:MAG: hypothetical protein K6T27_10100 [Thermoleophilum sp.]|nr:hypothetical protein [Thermoleophilum sp.]